MGELAIKPNVKLMMMGWVPGYDTCVDHGVRCVHVRVCMCVCVCLRVCVCEHFRVWFFMPPLCLLGSDRLS